MIEPKIATVLVAALLAACAGAPKPPSAGTPSGATFIGEPVRRALDGTTDDLLSAGLGLTGLRGAAPGFADPAHPTPSELRRRAIYSDYRGLADLASLGELPRVAGVEYLAGLDSPQGRSTAMLQIPSAFDASRPCLVAVASSGSRGIYGALPTAGAWGLKHGCAVVHTDKGTGTGLFDIATAQGTRIDGTLAPIGDASLLFAPTEAQLLEAKAGPEHAVLMKHANSGLNVEEHWGHYLLQAIDAGFRLLNREYASRAVSFTPANTLVIASGISNGGGTVLRALAQDSEGAIDGAVVSEPNITVKSAQLARFNVVQGGASHDIAVKPLYDIVVDHLLLQPCANLADPDTSAPFLAATAATRQGLELWCGELHRRGILSATGTKAQAQEARDKLIDLGVLPEALRLGHVNVNAFLWSAIGVAYASAYAKMPPGEWPCGVWFAASDPAGKPRAFTPEELARAHADSTGIAPTAGLALYREGADGVARVANFGSPEVALCLRELRNRATPGIEAVAVGAPAHRVPLIIVHGRGDGLIPVNHTSRAYAVANPSALYYEVEKGQHFDAFLPLPGFAGHYVAVQPYLEGAMDLMSAHLLQKSPLPPSQVVRERIALAPGSDAIRVQGATIEVPQ